MPKIETVSLEAYAARAYLAYAMSVVRGRAIPDVSDGLKPVQRRILYAMRRLRLDASATPMKSARVVGDVLGKYHPHGDGATYEAMVRMAQDFSLRYPLVHGEGNFGSRDGDPAAAYRYTEAKLTPLAAALLDELARDTVDFKPNFDGKEKEPATLPARLPFLLLNGTSGIAVGLATEFPSHNLREVVEGAKLIIRKPRTTDEELFELIPGPDFPTGSTLITPTREILSTYKNGYGSFRLRARWRKEDLGRGKWRLVFHEIPHGTNAEAVMMEISALLDPKPREKKGKKLPLTPEQIRLKKLFGELVRNYENGSDRNEAVRVVIHPVDYKMDPDALALTLCAHTSLERNVPANLVAVDRSGRPRQASLREWLGQWCEYRLDTVRRRLQDEKRAVDHRLHIIAGRLSILDRIQEVVKLLTASENPREDLMSRFGLDEIQADDILDMRLRSLARLERIKLEQERDRLLPEQSRLAKLLSDEKAFRKLVISELDADAKAFADDRRTELAPAEATSVRRLADAAVADKLAPEPVALALTERGWLSWRPAKSLEDALALDFKPKTGDTVRRIYFGDRNDHLVLMDDTGRAYSLHLVDLPSKADTLPLTTWFDPPAGTRFVEGAVAAPDHRFLVAGQKGYGFVVKASDWINRMKAGKAFLTLADGEHPLPPHPLGEALGEDAQVLALSTDGRAVVFPLADMKALPKGKGVAIMGLADGEALSDLAVFAPDAPPRLKGPRGPVALSAEHLDPLRGTRSAGKKGRRLHKHSPQGTFLRPGREEAQAPAAGS